MGTLGKDKLQAVYSNSNYFRESLIAMGCEVFGDVGSPVIPLMIYHPTKTTAFSRECLKRGLVRRVEVGSERQQLRQEQLGGLAAAFKTSIYLASSGARLVPCAHSVSSIILLHCCLLSQAVVVVGFPATPLMLARARFCISAGAFWQHVVTLFHWD